MKNVLFLFCLLVPFFTTAQDATNDNLKRYQLRAHSFYWETDCWDGTDYPTFLLKSAVDNNNTYDCLMPWTFNTPSGQDHCVQWDADAPTSHTQDIILKENLGGTANFKVDVEFQSWNENTCAGSRCILETGTIFCPSDDCSDANWCTLLNAGSGNATQWNDITQTAGNNSSVTYQNIWRYQYGDDFFVPLTFGTINSGTKTDVNSNRTAPTGASGNLAYSNYWNNTWAGTEMQDSPDVNYSFTISGSGKKVTASTDYSNTNFDSKIHLIRRFEDAGTFAYITSNDDIDGANNRKSRIIADLGPGEYLVIVEGFSTNTGDFKITVNATTAVVEPGSITQASPSSLCTGVPFPAISSSALASASSDATYGLGSLVYTWQMKIGNGSWTDISNSNVASLPTNAARTMGSATTTFRRKATLSGNVAYSNEVVFSYIASSLYPGSIELYGQSTIPAGTDPGSIDSFYDGSTYDDASGTPAPTAYSWEYSTDGGNSWSPAPGSTNSFAYNTPNLTESTRYRRVFTNGCNEVGYTNEIDIQVIVPDGIISGRVTDQFNNGIPDVTITATRTSSVPGGSLAPTSYTAMTDNDGYYTINDIYYGPSDADFTIVASKDDGVTTHTFTPESYTAQTISSTATQLSNINFTDLCVIPVVAGQVIWTGCEDTAWDNPANWNTGLVPQSGEIVKIDDTNGVTIFPVLSTVSNPVYKVEILTGASLSINTGGVLYISNNNTSGQDGILNEASLTINTGGTIYLDNIGRVAIFNYNTVINSGTININTASLGVWNRGNPSSFTNNGQLHLNDAGQAINNDQTGSEFINGSCAYLSFTGNSALTHYAGNFTNAGLMLYELDWYASGGTVDNTNGFLHDPNNAFSAITTGTKLNAPISYADFTGDLDGDNTAFCAGDNDDLPCAIVDPGLWVSPCNDNGTPDDPSDDTFYFTLQPMGDYLLTSYALDGDLTSGGYPYTSTTAFPNRPISAGVVSILIYDQIDPTCNYELTITPPDACSGNSCDEDIYLYSPDDNMNGGAAYVETNQNIIAENKINGATDATYDAGIAISLNPGFEVAEGAQFSAIIGGCDTINVQKEIEKKEVPE